MKHKLIPIIVLFLSLSSVMYGSDEGDFNIQWHANSITATARAEIAVDDTGQPLDGENGEAISLEQGRQDCNSRARTMALESLGRGITSLRIDPWTTLGELLETDFETRRKVSRALEGASCRTSPSGHGTQCTARLPMGDIVTSLPYRYPAEPFPRRDDVTIPTEYTSVIIDARGLAVTPMVFPSIFNSDGLEIFGRDYIDIRYALRYGAVTFVHTDEEALSHKKAGSNPLYCVALKEMRGCPVLSERDARKISSSDKTLAGLKKCRVIFIISRS